MNKSLYLSVEVFSTAVVIVDTEISKQKFKLVKNRNWLEADQFFIDKTWRNLIRDHRTEIHLATGRRIWTRDLRITTPAPFPQAHAVSCWRNVKPGSVHNWRIYILVSECTRGMVGHDLSRARYSVHGEGRSLRKLLKLTRTNPWIVSDQRHVACRRLCPCRFLPRAICQLFNAWMSKHYEKRNQDKTKENIHRKR